MVDFFFRVRCERGVRAVRCQAGSKGRERPHLTVQEAEDISLGSSGGRSARVVQAILDNILLTVLNDMPRIGS